jgi:CRP-like cAMP-binding protein
MSSPDPNAPLRQQLRTAPLLAALGDAQLDRLLRGAARVRLSPGQLLFRQDEPAERFYFVRDGRVRLFRLAADGSEKVVELIDRGQTFAEAVLFMREHGAGPGRFPVCAAALSESRLLAIDSADFAAMLRDSPETCFALLGDLSRRLHAMIAEIDSLTLISAEGRVARWLLHETGGNANGTGATLRLSVSKSVLASRLSIQPETWSRITRRLMERGMIRVDGDLVEILDRPALNRLAEGA